MQCGPLVLRPWLSRSVVIPEVVVLMSLVEDLERLEALRREGTLSDEEFQSAKSKLINEDSPTGGLGGALDNLSSDVNQWAMMIHLSQLFGFVVPVAGLLVPIILWQLKKETSETVDQHGRVVTNWIITEVILGFCSVILVYFLIGIPLLLGLAVVGVVFPVIGGIKANNGELWPYPMTINFLPVGEKPSGYYSDPEAEAAEPNHGETPGGDHAG